MQHEAGEDFYAHVADYASDGRYSQREKLAIEFAERFARDHLSMDEGGFFDRLRQHFSDAEIVDLATCCATFLGLGRLVQVLGPTVACPIGLGDAGPK